MTIAGLPTTAGDDTVTITPTGGHSVDAGGGVDTLIVDYSSLGADIRIQNLGGGWTRYTDDVRSTIDFVNFEKFNLTGGAGDDVLVGRDDVDTLGGGAGSDQIYGGLGADLVNGGTGLDHWTADYSTLGVAVTLTLLTTGAATLGGSGAQLTSIEGISLTTGAGSDRIDTQAFRADDAVTAGAGNDIVALGRGVDASNGGDDIDTMVMNWSGLADANANISWVNLGGGWGRYAAFGGDRLDFINYEKFVLTGGAGGDVLYGGALNDALTGNAGNDLLDTGAAGVDTVSGGAGLDTWRVNTSTRVGNTSINLETQASNFGAVLSGIEQIQFTGGNGADVVKAGPGVFNDSFTTGAGSDTITTGRGVDDLNAGDVDGTDTLVMDWSGITDIRFGITDTNLGGGWHRYAAASGDRLDYYGVEVFKLTGGAGDDRLYGGTLADTLIGGIGDDVLSSGTGGGTITGGDGVDRWQGDLSTAANVTFSAAASQTTAQLTVNGLSVTGIEALDLTTGNGKDSISTAGYALNDSVSSQGGNDTINTGLGSDWVNGGADTDVLVANYATATSAITQVNIGGGGTRLQMADGSAQIIYYDIERFALTGGTGNDTLNGGSLGDTLSGGAGDDSLNSGRGPDAVSGGTGVDTWTGDYSNAGINLSLTLTALGSGKVLGIGTSLTGIENVSISTGSGADTVNLSARTGNDSVSTGEGNDIVNLGRGQFEMLNAAGGTDTMTVSFALAATGIRMTDIGGGWWRAGSTGGDYRLEFYGVETVNLTGSARSDHLNGFGGNDALNGAAGVDFLDGGTGNDTLTGGTGADVFVFSVFASPGVDLVTDLGAGDSLRMAGIGLSGAMGTGDGSTLLAGQMDLSVSGAETELHLGLNATPGADFTVRLTGVFAASDFAFVGSDLMLL